MQKTGYAGHAIVGLVLALAGAAFFAMPIISAVLATSAIVMVSVGRAQFRANDELKGASLAVLALVIGVLTLGYLAYLFVFPFALIAIFGAPTGV